MIHVCTMIQYHILQYKLYDTVICIKAPQVGRREGGAGAASIMTVYYGVLYHSIA